MGDNRNRFVVGIDYGTTYSGAAYLYVDPEEGPDYSKINVIKSWPAGGGDNDIRTLDKTPTEISYEGGQTRWGCEIPPGTPRYSCFKLLLDEKTSKTVYDDPNLPGGVDDGPRPSLPDGKTVHDITFEYLKLFYEHVMKQLRRQVPSTFDLTPIHFVLTVPAIWSHAAQSATRDAAERAGFGSRDGDRVTMVSEPEAAGAYCLRDMHQGPGKELKVGERILICDAGGGTVDLATYEVSEITPCLRVREAVEGSGGKCGSTAIDRAFLKWLEPLVVQDPEGGNCSLQTGPGSTLMSTFESAKRSFGTTNHSQKWCIPLGDVMDDEVNGIEDGEFNLTSEHMAQFFDPVIKTVIDLATQQIKDANDRGKNKAARVILVGGFAESRYLRKKLIDWCQSQPFVIDAVTPKNSWTAVARGAVIHGIESLVDSRKLKEHYGVIMVAPFDPKFYDIDTAFYSPLYSCLMTDDHVEWFAAKGQEAASGQHFPIGGSSKFPEWSSRKVVAELVTSKLEDAPVSARRGGVHHVGLVESDLSSVPESAFNIERRSSYGGRKILHADVSIEMSVASADLKFEIMFKGERYGSTRIDYDHDGLSNTSTE